jgi:4-alpha-glucanotransferase
MKRTALRDLADRLGILPEYVEQTGRYVRRTSDRTREALLSVMGFDAPTEQAAGAWLAELDHEARMRLIETVRVVKWDARKAPTLDVQLPEGVREASVEITVRRESGESSVVRRNITRRGTIELPALPIGYHSIDCVADADRAYPASQTLIVVPQTCLQPKDLLGEGRDGRVMGIVANLYSVRREGDWGIGDFTTFARLIEWGASRNAEFVGVNPLHALFNRGMDVSPYSPVSRLFRNHIYIDVEAVPELASSPAARALLAQSSGRADIARLRKAAFVDYDGVIALKERVLRELHRTFQTLDAGSARAQEYHEFVRSREPELTRHATWMAIAESAKMPDWRVWPEAMRDPDSAAVKAFATANADQIAFHCWLQFETDRQLEHVAERARDLGMRIGAYQDLAIGTSPAGSDMWGDRGLFCEDASVGAPPDQYSSTGQVWGLPPINPRVLREEGYRYWSLLLRRAFDHAGALRIDHAIGLFRTFWVPNGGNGKNGAYVRFPAQDLLGILALESVRHNALVVGEDLGTVPKEVPPTLKKWGILSSKILYFEHDRRGFKPEKSYPPLALTTVNTHDMAPIAGWWQGRDLEIRARVGTLRTAAEIRRAKRERHFARKALLERLKLRRNGESEEEFLIKLASSAHAFLCRTPSVLVGQSLDDLIGERDPVNVPGVGQDRYPNWRRKTSITVEEMTFRKSVDTVVRCDTRRAR